MEWTVEALRDGRLGDREVASAERHIATCPSCQRLSADLDRIRRALRTPVEAPTPLEVQRYRARLLRAAASPAPRTARFPAPRVAFALAVAAAAAVLLWISGAGRPLPPLPVAATAASSGSVATTAPLRVVTTIEPEDGARYVRAVDGTTETVALQHGAVTCRVRHLHAGERFLVTTTDAEVEVRGTVFRVAATLGLLRSVAVTEGTVEVRYHGGVTLVRAGGEWHLPDEDGAAQRDPAPSSSAGAVGSARPPASEPVREPRASAQDGVGRRPAASGGVPKRPPASPGLTKTGELEEGVRLVERGDYGAAVEHLERYEREQPGAAGAEDAAFLVVISLQRAGKRAEAAAAAQRYLARYPKGLRRAEAEAIVRAGALPTKE